jgi:SAM-dependent methyltransferase
MHTLALTDRTNCPGCRTARTTPVYRTPLGEDPLRTYLLDFYDGRLDADSLEGDFALVDCAGCGLLYQVRVPAPSEVAAFYEQVVDAERDDVEHRRGATVRGGAQLDLRRTVRRAGRPAAQVDILDYGAGTGLWLDVAAEFGCRTTGAEIDPGARARLEAAGHATVDHDELPGSAFDLVNLEQVLEHVLEPLEVMGRVASAVRPDGLVRVCVPNGAGVRGLLADPDWSAPKGTPRSLNAVAPLEHVNCFDHGSLVAVGLAAGLEPFRFPIGVDLAGSRSVRGVLGALKRQVIPPAGTLVWFRRPADSLTR